MNRDEILQQVAENVRNPLKTLEAWKGRTGGKVMGCLSCMPPFVPEELVYAAGMLPAGIWGAEVPVSRADARMQSFSCSVARTALELALRNSLAVCDGFIFPFACDAFQNLSEIWKASVDRPCLQLVFPRKADANEARIYLEAELGRIKAELEAFSGRPVSRDDLNRGIRVYNENRRLLREVDRVRFERPGFVSARDMMSLVLASGFLPREEHSDLLRSLLACCGEGPGPESTGQAAGTERVSVFLTGTMPRPAAILDMMDEVGVRVAGDDMGLGSLYYSVDVDEAEDTVRALAAAYSRYPACSTVHNRGADRGAALLQRARETGVDGVLIFATKFCEPEYFDFPFLKEDLEKGGIPVLLLETELGKGIPGPLRTRVEAFVEILRGRKTSQSRPRTA